MAELAHLQASRKAFKSHVMRLYNKIDYTMGNQIDEHSIVSLTTFIEQLISKKGTLASLDEQIEKLITDAEEIEEVVSESLELQDEIMDKITQTRRFIELQSRPKTPMLAATTTVEPQSVVNHDSSPQGESSLTVESSASTVVTTPASSLVDSLSLTSIVEATPIVHSAVNSPTVHSEINHDLIAATHTIQQSGSATHVQTVTTTTAGISFAGPPPLIPVSQSVTTASYSGSYQLAHTSPLTVTPGHQSYHTAPQFSSSRLPKLSLPTFSGEPLSWQTFWDSYNAAIHSNPSLSGIQKFNYLKAQLHGDAARTIAGLPLTELNYQHSIDLLRDRFGQPHKLVAAHMQALLEIPKPTSTLTSLRVFHDTIESHTRGLSSLGKSESSYGEILVPIILGKLTDDIRRNLARENSNTEWTLTELMSAILKEIRILESGPHNPIKAQHTATFLIESKEAHNKQRLVDNKKKPSCVFCKGPHSAHTCNVVTDHQQRLEIVKRDNLCFNCLAHHKVSNCTSRFRCRKCQRKHHTSLCNGGKTTKPASSPVTSDTQTVQGDSTQASAYVIPTANQNATSICLLKTAIAPIQSDTMKCTANILFDEGAQRSFITEQLARALQIIPTITEKVALSSFGTTSHSYQQLGATTILIETNMGDLIPLKVLIVPSIAIPIQNSFRGSLSSVQHLQGLKLAHPVTTDQNFEVNVLIGADHYWSFVQDHIVRGNGPTAQQSKLGYLLSGPLRCADTSLSSSVMLQLTSTDDESQQLPLQQFWSIEAIGTNTHKPNISFLNKYQSTSVSQNKEGTYVAKFPWKDDRPFLPSNYSVAQKRTRALLSKMRKTPDLLQLYKNILEEQEKRGFIERVDDSTKVKDVHYLPHHPVKKNSPTTPVRIVYDCSCRESNNSASLNDCLTVGPPFLNDLCAILLRFRTHPYAFTTDIEKAFLHVQLHESDRDYTRFLWPAKPQDPNSELNIYRFAVVPFGTASSPFMLNATINLHLSKFRSDVATDIQRNIYVDNLLSGCNTEDGVLEYYTQARTIMGQAKFNLRSWASNSSSLQKKTINDKTIDSNSTVTILGLHWNTATDTLSLAPKSFPSINTVLITKRDVLQFSSQIYDPLGWTTPVTIRAKILLQEIWQDRLPWDEPLPSQYKDKWLSILSDLVQLPNFIIPRVYFREPSATTDTYKFFVFCDASIKAYGAVVYLCKHHQISLVMSKSRVAPIKTLTLPKLELMAAVMATRLAQFVRSSLIHEFSPVNIHFWSDSQIVLHWIYKRNTTKPFIANRIAEIVDLFPPNMWSFTPSNDNPADLLTRGISTDQLLSSQIWSQGPQWLTSESSWPRWLPTNILHLQLSDSPGTDDTATQQDGDQNITGIHNVIDVFRYSSINKLLAVTSYVLRFINNALKQRTRIVGPLHSSELNTAEKLWISSSQKTSYKQEITYLTQKQNSCPTLVKQLRLFFDKDKLLRCGGRIHNAPVSESTKFPLFFLPNTTLLL